MPGRSSSELGDIKKIAVKEGCPLRVTLDEIRERCYEPLNANPFTLPFKPIFGSEFLKMDNELFIPPGKVYVTVIITGVFNNQTFLFLQSKVTYFMPAPAQQAQEMMFLSQDSDIGGLNSVVDELAIIEPQEVVRKQMRKLRSWRPRGPRYIVN